METQIEKHPSYGWVTIEEIREIENAPSPTHRKQLFKELEKKSKKGEAYYAKHNSKLK